MTMVKLLTILTEFLPTASFQQSIMEKTVITLVRVAAVAMPLDIILVAMPDFMTYCGTMRIKYSFKLTGIKALAKTTVSRLMQNTSKHLSNKLRSRLEMVHELVCTMMALQNLLKSKTYL